MTEIAAAMGLTNLEELDEFVAINRATTYQCYREAIAPIPGLSVLEYDESERNNFQYIVVEVAPDFPVSRDRIIEVLHAENVLARKYFWPGCHNMQPYRALATHTPVKCLPRRTRFPKKFFVLPTVLRSWRRFAFAIASVLSALACLQTKCRSVLTTFPEEQCSDPFNPSISEGELRAMGFKSVGDNVRIAKNCTIIGLANMGVGD